MKRWQQENPERLNAYRRARRLEPEVKRRERGGHLMRKFGITLEEYDAMLEAQDGACAICGRPPRGHISLHVDHDHFTGMVRALLCFSCNNALAYLQEDPQLLAKAMGYLASHANPELDELIRRRALGLRAS